MAERLASDWCGQEAGPALLPFLLPHVTLLVLLLPHIIHMQGLEESTHGTSRQVT